MSVILFTNGEEKINIKIIPRDSGSVTPLKRFRCGDAAIAEKKFL